jgi:hypothetical protein
LKVCQELRRIRGEEAPGDDRAVVEARLAENTDAQLAALNLTGDAFHPEWNYTINPRGN